MPPKPELLHHSTTKTLVVEEGVAGEAPFGRFSSLSQGYRSHVTSPTERRIRSYMNLSPPNFAKNVLRSAQQTLMALIASRRPNGGRLALRSPSGTFGARFSQEIRYVNARVCIRCIPLFISPFGRSEGVDGGTSDDVFYK